MKKLLLYSVLAFSTLSFAQAQEKCKTMIRHEALMNSSPSYKQGFHHADSLQMKRERSGAKTAGVVYRIPVVVHVLHLGTPVGSVANISDAQIYSAIVSLNNAYRKVKGTGGDGNGADAEMEFGLAQKDPNGNPHSGIIRVDASAVSTYATEGITDANEITVKAVSKWPNNKYYNIWVVSEIDDNNAGSGTQGYAYLPSTSTSSAAWDGAVMLYNSFGYDPTNSKGYNLKTYTNRNITLIHELGHAFSLYHSFEGDGSGSTCPPVTNGCGTGQGDCVADTPPHQRSNSDCVVGTNTCTGGSTNEYIHNYMDYSSDDCQSEFTAGQVARMRAALAVAPRASLVTSTNLAATGCDGTTPPVLLNFEALNSNPCAGQPTEFIDQSINNFGSWTWTFANGTPSTSTARNPTASFPAGGPYSVSLSAGGLQVTKATAIQGVQSSLSSPFTENFEGGNFPPAGWHLKNPDGGNISWGTAGAKTWSSHAVQGNGTSTSAAAINCYQYKFPGELDGLISPPVDLSSFSNASLQFKVSYRIYDSSTSDSLNIYASKDCGISYTKIFSKGGSDLAVNNSALSASWVPSISTDWRTETVDLSSFAGNSVIIKFESFNDYGNNIYVDDVNVTGSGVAVPVAGFSASKVNIISGETTVFTSNSTGSINTYTWNFGTDASLPANTTGVGPHTVSYSSNGQKTVTLTVSGPGGTNTSTKTNYITVGAAGLSAGDYETSVSLYPNPSTGFLNIVTTGNAPDGLEIYNQLGKLCKVVGKVEAASEINIQDLDKGVYLVRVHSSDRVITKKLVVSY